MMVQVWELHQHPTIVWIAINPQTVSCVVFCLFFCVIFLVTGHCFKSQRVHLCLCSWSSPRRMVLSPSLHFPSHNKNSYLLQGLEIVVCKLASPWLLIGLCSKWILISPEACLWIQIPRTRFFKPPLSRSHQLSFLRPTWCFHLCHVQYILASNRVKRSIHNSSEDTMLFISLENNNKTTQ